MKQVIFLIVCVITINNAFAQNPDCKVLTDSLKGTYEGECVNGKANGKGKAIGFATYEGDFKNGYPDGKGKYTWSNGDFFYGDWKKGLKDGKGELHSTSNGKETVVNGYWKKDKYKGEYEKPYIIHNTATGITRVEVSKVGSDEKTVTISVTLLAGGGNNNSRNNTTTMTMTSYQIVRGLFLYKSNSTISNKDVTVFRGVDFPFRGIFYFGNTNFEIEIFEPGEWDILVPIL